MNGFRVIFENKRGIITKGDNVIAIAHRNELELYELNFKKVVHANVSMRMNELELWHKRMGHLNYEDLKRLQKQTVGINTKFVDSSHELCEICIEGKQTPMAHNKHRKRAKRPLQLIHSDLIGPISPISHQNMRYVLTFIDDYSHFTCAYILASKTEVLRYFKVFEAMATAHFNLKISRFRCDNGREYLSSEIKQFFESKGIQVEFTVRYTPQQNGVAERMNRTILQKARCMLLHSKLEKTF